LELEYKNFPLEIKEVNDKGTFIGIASPYNNIDDGNDRVLKTVGPRNNGKKVPILYQHDPKVIIGSQKLSNIKEGVQTNAQLILDKDDNGNYLVPKAPEAYALLKNGLLQLSIGYRTLDFEYVTEKGQTIRNLKDIDIMEVSLVTFPMNEKAKISDVKSNGGGNMALPIADKKVKWDGSAAAKRVFDKYTDKEGNIDAESQKAFFYVDTSKPNEKGSYKFGFADIVGDKLTAIPAGIQAAANAIRGARTPSDLPLDTKRL